MLHNIISVRGRHAKRADVVCTISAFHRPVQRQHAQSTRLFVANGFGKGRGIAVRSSRPRMAFHIVQRVYRAETHERFMVEQKVCKK